MGFTESNLMRMTPRKFFRLMDEWLELNNPKKRHTSNRKSTAGLDIDGLP